MILNLMANIWIFTALINKVLRLAIYIVGYLLADPFFVSKHVYIFKTKSAVILFHSLVE